MPKASTVSQPDLERRLIADLIYFGPEALALAIESGIKLGTFADPSCQQAFETILSAHAVGQQADVLTLARSAKLPMSEVTRLTQDPSPTTAYLRADCDILTGLSTRRGLIALAMRLQSAAATEPDKVPETISSILATQAQAAVARPWGQIVEDVKAKAQQACDPKHDPDAGSISWGWQSLDRAFRRLRRKELSILAARPSVGKSSLMRQVVGKAALDGLHVAVFSLEVPADDVVQQMASAMTGIPFATLGQAHPADQRAHLAAYDRLKAAPMHCYDQDYSLASIVARSRSLAAQRPLDIVAIDYLGLMSDCEASKGGTKAQSIGLVTKALKRLASSLDCVCIVLAQLNRASVNDDNRVPRLADLRDSGDIEQDADRVVFLHRPDSCPIRDIPQGTQQDVTELPRYGMQVIQDKGRNVGTGWGQMWFHRQLARFEEVAKP